MGRRRGSFLVYGKVGKVKSTQYLIDQKVCQFALLFVVFRQFKHFFVQGKYAMQKPKSLGSLVEIILRTFTSQFDDYLFYIFSHRC
jgi:hypothetical protein